MAYTVEGTSTTALRATWDHGADLAGWPTPSPRSKPEFADVTVTTGGARWTCASR